MKVNLTHEDIIKTFSDVAFRLELEDESLGAAKVVSNVFAVELRVQNLQLSSIKNSKRNGKDKENGEGPHKKKERANIQQRKNDFSRRETKAK